MGRRPAGGAVTRAGKRFGVVYLGKASEDRVCQPPGYSASFPYASAGGPARHHL